MLPLGTLAAGILLEWAWPLAGRVHFLSPGFRFTAAALLFLPGAALFFGSGRALRRAGTDVNPSRPTTAVVQRWPFSWSRNPMYLGGNLVYLALSLAVPLYWALLLFPLPALLCHYLVVLREEEYLAEKFGGEYRDYCRRVPRWF
ncbi:MAG TPA: isoprenylcysteine carboxylmethyltransferase family protein [Lacunisphaera sp.]|nr:isoprenylcysteine carboxylmethyltransferase family protein [Lacunisphaera sp.]